MEYSNLWKWAFNFNVFVATQQSHTMHLFKWKMYVILLEENLFILRWWADRQIPSSQSIPVERDVQGSFLPRNRKQTMEIMVLVSANMAS